MASENANLDEPQDPESGSENSSSTMPTRRGRAPARLSGAHAVALEEYIAALAAAPVAEQTRRTYASKVRQYLVWLAGAELDRDPLSSADGRDWAVRDYRTYLQTVLKRKPATVNNVLAAVDDLYIRLGLGPANAKRVEIPDAAPKALDERGQIRFLRAVQSCRSPRDRALALIPFYAGARISETVALDIDDVRLCQLARRSSASTAKGTACEKFRSIASSARCSRTGQQSARTGPGPTGRRCSSTSVANA